MSTRQPTTKSSKRSWWTPESESSAVALPSKAPRRAGLSHSKHVCYPLRVGRRRGWRRILLRFPRHEPAQDDETHRNTVFVGRTGSWEGDGDQLPAPRHVPRWTFRGVRALAIWRRIAGRPSCRPEGHVEAARRRAGRLAPGHLPYRLRRLGLVRGPGPGSLRALRVRDAGAERLVP